MLGPAIPYYIMLYYAMKSWETRLHRSVSRSQCKSQQTRKQDPNFVSLITVNVLSRLRYLTHSSYRISKWAIQYVVESHYKGIGTFFP